MICKCGKKCGSQGGNITGFSKLRIYNAVVISGNSDPAYNNSEFLGLILKPLRLWGARFEMVKKISRRQWVLEIALECESAFGCIRQVPRCLLYNILSRFPLKSRKNVKSFLSSPKIFTFFHNLCPRLGRRKDFYRMQVWNGGNNLNIVTVLQQISDTRLKFDLFYHQTKLF